MKFKCVGCDEDILWDGQGLFSYICHCGARVFYTENGGFSVPASFMMNLMKGNPMPHLDDLVGESDYHSEIKDRFISFLQDIGYIWMKDCKQCRDEGSWQRKLDREKAMGVREAERIIRSHRWGIS